MNEVIPSKPVPIDVERQARELWMHNRRQCGWYLRDNLIPGTRDEIYRCLTILAKHGDRATYVVARKLMKCL